MIVLSTSTRSLSEMGCLMFTLSLELLDSKLDILEHRPSLPVVGQTLQEEAQTFRRLDLLLPQHRNSQNHYPSPDISSLRLLALR